MADTKWKEVETNVWKPEAEGDQIQGVLIRKQPGTKDMSPRYTIETKEGPLMVWGSAVLADRIEPLAEGSLIRITFEGKKRLDGKKTLNQFKVEVAETETETDEADKSQKKTAKEAEENLEIDIEEVS